MKVKHPRFGQGRILQIEGEGNNRKATVFFAESGQKQLLLRFARLKIVTD
jgi:DNA helicase-2/ATP-dependent DNA helicase PcrA